MTNPERAKDFLESSFLSPLLQREGITDISYNGESLFYEDASKGRRKSGILVSSEDVGSFLRQIANFCEKQFSYMSPILDVSFGKYRLNASFLSLTRVYDRKSYSFSLRIGRMGSAVMGDKEFFPGKTKPLLLDALLHGESIVIAGETGAGKTELQKYLIMQLPDATRVIVIDNIGELGLCRGDEMIDMTVWAVDENFEGADFPTLIRNALRNNPDYLIVAEARGGEMLSALNAVMSGHPIITTLHAKDLYSIPHRMARMAQTGDRNLVYEDLLTDIYHHFGLLVYVTKEKGKSGITRRISMLGRVNEKTREIDILYPEPKTEEDKK